MATHPDAPLVGREKELAFVQQQLSLMPGARYRVLGFYGVSGVGKSAFLDASVSSVQTVFPVDAIRLKTNDVSRDFIVSHLEDDSRQAGWARFRVLQQLREQLEGDDVVLSKVRTIDARATDEDYENGAAEVADEIVRRSRERRVVFAIDDWHEVHDVIPPWLERNVFKPMMVESQHTAILLTSNCERPLSFWTIEVRNSARNIPLHTLSVEETQKQLGIDATTVQAVYEFTGGIPGLNVSLKEDLDKAKTNLFTEPLEISLGLVTEFLHNYREVSQNPSSQELLYILSQFRSFDLGLYDKLRGFLPRDVSSQSDTDKYFFFKYLTRAGLVEWSDELKSYTIPPAVRQVMSNVIKYMDPAKYIALHTEGANYFKSVTRGTMLFDEVRVGLMLEGLYHSLIVSPTVDTYKNTCASFFERMHEREREHLRPLLEERLRKDEEIQKMLGTIGAV